MSTTVPAVAAVLGVTEADWNLGLDAIVATRMQAQPHASADAMRATVTRELTADYEQQAEGRLELYAAAERTWSSSPEIREAYRDDMGAFLRTRMGAIAQSPGGIALAQQRNAEWEAAMRAQGGVDPSTLHARLARYRAIEVMLPPKGD